MALDVLAIIGIVVIIDMIVSRAKLLLRTRAHVEHQQPRREEQVHMILPAGGYQTSRRPGFDDLARRLRGGGGDA